eukprot:COSAG02_NODE_262_length_26647_cov_21.607240_7_plen_708_part_00
MRTLHDFFQRRPPAAEVVERVAEESVQRTEAESSISPPEDDASSVSPPVSPPASTEEVAAPCKKRWADLSTADRAEHWAEQPRRQRRRRDCRGQRPAAGRPGSFQRACGNQLVGLPVEAWRRVYRRSWAAPLSLALENRDIVEPRGSSWGGEAARVARQNGVRDVVVDIQFDQVGALLAAACRDGRVQVHDFDEFQTRLSTLADDPVASETITGPATQLPPRCEDTSVLTLVAPRQVGAGVAWDTATESHLWSWYRSSNAVHLYDIERCQADVPTRVYKPSASAAAGGSELSTGISAAQFATAGGTAILSTVFVVGGRGGSVYFYDKRSKTVPIYSIEGRYGAVHSMQLSVDGQLLLFSTSGSRQSNPMLLGYDVRAICSHSAVGRESKRVLGEKQGSRGCLLSLGVDESFRAPRPVRANGEGDITWVENAYGVRVSQLTASSTSAATEWSYVDRGVERPAVVPATTIALSPCGANQLAYQLEDGSVGQLDLARLCSSWRRGVDDGGGPPHGRAFGLSALTADAAGSPRRTVLPFTQPPIPARRRFPAGFAIPSAGGSAMSTGGIKGDLRRTSPIFYHDTHASLLGGRADDGCGGTLSLHDFSAYARPFAPDGLGANAEAAEAAFAMHRARNPMASLPLGNVTRPCAVAFHPAGDTLVIGGEKNTIFVRQVRCTQCHTSCAVPLARASKRSVMLHSIWVRGFAWVGP